MNEPLNDNEARVLGCLIEKSLTTPELYPLTLNSLLNACNQKSSRDPVMSLGYPEVEAAVNSLAEKGYAAHRYESGARAAKYGHRVEVLLNTEDPKIIGMICVLFLRGPQTAGEIKGRTERLCSFESVAEVEGLLTQLASRVDGAIVERMARQTGQKEARYRQLFTGKSAGETAASEVPAPVAPDRLAELEKRVAALEAKVNELALERVRSA